MSVLWMVTGLSDGSLSDELEWLWITGFGLGLGKLSGTISFIECSKYFWPSTEVGLGGLGLVRGGKWLRLFEWLRLF
jgi:hypothetical protein